MTTNPDPSRPAVAAPDPAASTSAPATGVTEPTDPAAAPAPAAGTSDPSASDPASAPVAPAPAPEPPRRRFRLGRRAVAALVLVGVLLVGGAGGFAIGRATAPDPAFPTFERGGGPGGQLPGGGSGDGELPQPPSDRSGGEQGGSGSDQGSGSADDGSTTDSSATT